MYSTPFHMLSAVTYGGITYGMGGLRAGADPFARYSLILTLVFLISSQVRQQLQDLAAGWLLSCMAAAALAAE